MGSAQGLIDVAYTYLGTTEDDPRFAELIEYYNEHTEGYDMRMWDEWCACFVSVCALKSNNADATGTSVNCNVFRSIWREKGIYRERWETPEPGWLINYDWQQDGIPDHIGIVVDCDGETIHVIEGNTDGEMCAEHWIPVGSWSISCFGAPEYSEDTEEVFNMAEALFYIEDNHEGYLKNDIVYWNPSAGFCYLEHMDCVKLIQQCSPDIPYIHSSKSSPWIVRAKQATNPAIAAQTYGKRE